MVGPIRSRASWWPLLLAGTWVCLTGCPNGCNWPTDKCQNNSDCPPDEWCVWSGNNGVGGFNFCAVECEPGVQPGCSWVDCEPDKRWAPDGTPCSQAGTDPTWQLDENGQLLAQGSYAPAQMGRTEGTTGGSLDCACPVAVADGQWLSWDEQGTLIEEANYLLGWRHGPQRRYYPTGQIDFEQIFASGLAHGTIRDWYSNGQLEYEGQYANDYGEGIWRYYFSNGALRGEIEFRHGQQVAASYWDEDGNPIDSMLPASEE